tara:strand:+ start:157 stop:912 length:756 start_codon:yes stop_codon:yes gene_type:complete
MKTTRKKRVEWPKTPIDWTKSNHEIAEELSITYEVVCSNRRKRAPETCVSLIKWVGVNWKKENIQLASELNTTYSTIWRKRKQYAPETMKERDRFKDQDWAKASTVIAAEKGCCITQVSRARRKFAPETSHTHKLNTMELMKRKEALRNSNWELTDKEIAMASGLRVADIKKSRMKYDPASPLNNAKYPNTGEVIKVGQYMKVWLPGADKFIVCPVVALHGQPWVTFDKNTPKKIRPVDLEQYVDHFIQIT